MLPDIPQCTGLHPGSPTKHHSVPKINVTEGEKQCSSLTSHVNLLLCKDPCPCACTETGAHVSPLYPILSLDSSACQEIPLYFKGHVILLCLPSVALKFSPWNHASKFSVWIAVQIHKSLSHLFPFSWTPGLFLCALHFLFVWFFCWF